MTTLSTGISASNLRFIERRWSDRYLIFDRVAARLRPYFQQILELLVAVLAAMQDNADVDGQVD